jgi:PhnB protein
MAAKPIPEGFNTLSSYLIVKNADDAIDFYQRAFGAELGARLAGPDGKSTMHAEMRIGNSMFMLTEENPQWGMKAPESLGGTPVSLHIYVDDCDKLWDRAIQAGGKEKAPLMDAFWGDRYGKLTDPFGHEWGIATHKEDLTEEEIGKRAAEWFASMAEGDCQ